MKRFKLDCDNISVQNAMTGNIRWAIPVYK